MQFCWIISTNHIYVRRLTNTSWTSWRYLLNSSDLTSSVTSDSTAPITSQGVYNAIPVMNFVFESSNSLTLGMVSATYRKVCIYNQTSYYEFVVHEWGAQPRYHWIVGTALPSDITTSYSNYRLTFTTTGTYRICIEAPDGRTAISSYT